MAGRPPKPTRLKILQGNPGKRPLNRAEPQPELGVPTRPEWLSPEAKREWSRVVPELARLGLIARIDRALIAAYCVAWGNYVEALADIKEHGKYFVTDRGYEGPRPSVGIAAKAVEQMLQLSARFGLTPSDRGKLHLPEQKPADPFEAFLANGRDGTDG
jgi:P27 family predicted phage terminase small subunit